MDDNMKKTKCVILYAGPSQSGPLFKVLDFVLQDYKVESCDHGVTSGAPGILAASNSQEFHRGLASLLRCGCRRIAVLDGRPAEWVPADLPLHWSVVKSLHDVCTFGKTGKMELTELCAWLAREEPTAAHDSVSHDTLLKFAQATNLFFHIAGFSHGGQFDITNSFLAPARILAEAHAGDCEAAKQPLSDLLKNRTQVPAFERFHNAVQEISSSRHLMGSLGDEMVKIWACIEEICTHWSSASSASSSESLANTTSSLMALLTEMRERAGGAAEGSSGAGQPVKRITRSHNGASNKQPPFRVLIVDDNAHDWEPVFEVLAQQVANRVESDVHLEFSTDGINVLAEGTPTDMWSLLPDYDVVLLDLYLPTTQPIKDVPQGITILRRIRERLLRLPVIVWTSSMDANLPAQTTQANGFLFKKDTTLNDMLETIVAWLPCGRGTRGFSLLNPFFDNVIRSPGNRKIAVGFTYWALKIMDGLHGLDQCYFRFFNDHGGRHLNGVLCNLEKLIRPLLLTDGGNSTFSVERENFEREMLWLYVATLCHDTGMFPLPCEDETVVSRRPELLKKARTQHGLRVLALLNCSYLGSKHKELARLTEALDETIRMPISLIASYHSQSNRPKFPLEWLKTGNAENEHSGLGVNPRTDPVLPACTAACTCCLLAQAEESDKKPSDNLIALMRHYAARTISLTPRMDRLCALLRLADGVDIDFTRLPASHLLEDSGRSVRDDFENFKRQVLEYVCIDRGVIDFAFRLPGKIDSVDELTDSWLKWRQMAVAAGKSDSNIEKATNCLTDLATALSKANPIKLCDQGFGEIAEGCDTILDVFFRMRFRPSGSSEYIAISMVAVLAVWCEVNERYAGIIETELNQDIKLGTVTFRKTGIDNLSILKCAPCCEARASSICPSTAHALRTSRPRAVVQVETKILQRMTPHE